MQPKQRILVVADRTADAPELVAALRRRADAGPTGFTLLVPADADGLAWGENTAAAWSRAISRAELAAARVRDAGLELEEAIVGDPDPAIAVGDARHVRSFDEVVFVRREPTQVRTPRPARVAA